MTHPLSASRALCLLGLSLTVLTARADADVKRPDVDTAALPAIAPGWADLNPLRGNADAARIGGTIFNQTCARCHGENANGMRSPAPDLRRIGMACQRVKDPALRQRCLSDADHFFVKSVRYGKQKFGIVHMPTWDGVLARLRGNDPEAHLADLPGNGGQVSVLQVAGDDRPQDRLEAGLQLLWQAGDLLPGFVLLLIEVQLGGAGVQRQQAATPGDIAPVDGGTEAAGAGSRQTRSEWQRQAVWACSGGGSAGVAQGLAAIDVPAIPGQSGWLVRNALTDRLGVAVDPEVALILGTGEHSIHRLDDIAPVLRARRDRLHRAVELDLFDLAAAVAREGQDHPLFDQGVEEEGVFELHAFDRAVLADLVHLAVGQGVGVMEEAADEGGLAVVDVADDDDVHLAMVFGGGLRGAHFGNGLGVGD